jgi:rhodanese-related sulfurtransferase
MTKTWLLCLKRKNNPYKDNMKKQYFSILSLLALLFLSLAACSGNKSEKKPVADTEEVKSNQPKPQIIVGNETSLLLKDLAENGNYVNSKAYPSLIKASVVNENIGKNQLVIDIRSAKLYSEGHIRGSVNKKFEDLPSYFETGIKPFEFDKIIIVSDDGQVSSYTTCLLRLMGYANVYSMRWGMSAWNTSYANAGWLKDVSGKFESQLESKENERSNANTMPQLNTGKASGDQIGADRFKKLFAEGVNNVLITADEVFSNPAKYYIVNLERKDKYENGHIPGAVRYKPDATIGFVDEMGSIPPDKTVVVYCGTGHNSGFATAYLRLFGYDARTLRYGNNGFMHDKMVEERIAMSWLPFTTAEVNDFEVVK